MLDLILLVFLFFPISKTMTFKCKNNIKINITINIINITIRINIIINTIFFNNSIRLIINFLICYAYNINIPLITVKIISNTILILFCIVKLDSWILFFYFFFIKYINFSKWCKIFFLYSLTQVCQCWSYNYLCIQYLNLSWVIYKSKWRLISALVRKSV